MDSTASWGSNKNRAHKENNAWEVTARTNGAQLSVRSSEASTIICLQSADVPTQTFQQSSQELRSLQKRLEDRRE
jgi:hypothetical protein